VKCVKVINPRASFDPRSFRTVSRGTTRVLVGCPKGKWKPRAQWCAVGLRAYEVIKPARGRCKSGYARK
jgi:hypothetical protein